MCECHPGLQVTPQSPGSTALRSHLAPSHCAPCPAAALCSSAPPLLGAAPPRAELPRACGFLQWGGTARGAPREHGAASTIPWEQHGGHRGLPSGVECGESLQDVVLSLTEHEVLSDPVRTRAPPLWGTFFFVPRCLLLLSISLFPLLLFFLLLFFPPFPSFSSSFPSFFLSFLFPFPSLFSPPFLPFFPFLFSPSFPSFFSPPFLPFSSLLSFPFPPPFPSFLSFFPFFLFFPPSFLLSPHPTTPGLTQPPLQHHPGPGCPAAPHPAQPPSPPEASHSAL